VSRPNAYCMQQYVFTQRTIQKRRLCTPFVILDDPGAGLRVHRRVQLALQYRGEALNPEPDAVPRQPELHVLFGDALGHPHARRDVLRRLLPEVNGIWERGRERERETVLKLMMTAPCRWRESSIKHLMQRRGVEGNYF